MALTDITACSILSTDASGNVICASATSVATAWNNIGDATGNGSIDVTGYTTEWTSLLDGGSVFTLTSTDTDVGSDTRLIDLGSYDASDANGIFIRARSDVDGTPADVYVLDQAKARYSVPIEFAGSSGTAGSIDLYEDPANGTNFTRIQVPALSADWTLTAPPDNGDAGEVLQTDGNGVTTWEPAGTGDITTVGDVLTGPAFEGTAGTVLTFNNASGDQTLTYSVGADLDFNFSDDVNIRDTHPHVRWIPASGNSFEIYNYASELWLNNVTAGTTIWKINAANAWQFTVPTSVTGSLVVSGPLTVDGNITVGNGTTGAGKVQVNEDVDNGPNWLAFQAPSAVTTNQTCTFENDASFIPDSCVGDGTDGGSSGNSFETLSVPAGTNPVADSATDTLTITEGTGVDITGTAGTDTLDFTPDLTEFEAVTWGAGGNATNTWTFNLSGTDPTLTFGSGTVTGPTVAATNFQMGADTISDLTGGGITIQGGKLQSTGFAVCFSTTAAMSATSFSPISGSKLSTGTSGKDRMKWPMSGTFKNLYTGLGTASGASGSWTICLEVADTITNLCETLNNVTGGSGNTVNTATVTLGQTVGYSWTETGTAADAVSEYACVQFVPD